MVSQQGLRTTALFSLSACPNRAMSTCSCVQDVQQSFPLWHKHNPSQIFYIHEMNSVSIPGVKHAPLGSKADCMTLWLLPHYIRFQPAYLHYTTYAITAVHDALCQRTRHKLTNKRSISYTNLQLQTLSKTKFCVLFDTTLLRTVTYVGHVTTTTPPPPPQLAMVINT